jgi:hypothetical protein
MNKAFLHIFKKYAFGHFFVITIYKFILAQKGNCFAGRRNVVKYKKQSAVAVC